MMELGVFSFGELTPIGERLSARQRIANIIDAAVTADEVGPTTRPVCEQSVPCTDWRWGSSHDAAIRAIELYATEVAPIVQREYRSQPSSTVNE